MRVVVERILVHESCSICGGPIDGIAIAVTAPTHGSASFGETCGEGALREFRDDALFRWNLRAGILAGGRPDLLPEAESITLVLSGLDAY